MTNEEYKKLTEEYVNVCSEFSDYVKQFTTSLSLDHRAAKTLNREEREKIKTMRQHRDEIEKKWFGA